MNRAEILRWFERHYIYLASAVACVCIFAGWYDQGQTGILRHYAALADMLTAGFDFSKASPGILAFPMWGYAFLLILTDNAYIIIALQVSLGLYTTQRFVAFVEERVAERWFGIALKLLVVLALGWYASLKLLMPNAIASCLFLLSFVRLLGKPVLTQMPVRDLVISGLLFGFALQFRSDYFGLPFAFSSVLLLLHLLHRVGELRIAISRLVIWLVSISFVCVPWAIYTLKAEGAARVTSTNGGHVLYIGLGQLRGNKWGITPSDGDPSLQEVIKRAGSSVSSLSAEGDRILKAEYFRLIKNDPFEYLRKIVSSSFSVIWGGVHSGNFFATRECIAAKNCMAQYNEALKLYRGRHSLEFYTTKTDFSIRMYGLWLQEFSRDFSRRVVALSFLGTLATVLFGFVRRSSWIILLVVTIWYQAVLSMVGFYMAYYTSNFYLLHLANVLIAAVALGHGLRWCVLPAHSFIRRKRDQSLAAVSEEGMLVRLRTVASRLLILGLVAYLIASKNPAPFRLTAVKMVRLLMGDGSPV